jgi:hypothetical protein
MGTHESAARDERHGISLETAGPAPSYSSPASRLLQETEKPTSQSADSPTASGGLVYAGVVAGAEATTQEPAQQLQENGAD